MSVSSLPNIRLGNTQEGDGWKYRGRGIIQITGRKIYTEFNKYAHKMKLVDDEVDFVDNPELVAENKDYALMSAAYYWIKENIYEKADESKSDSGNENVVNKITNRINSGTSKENRTKRINSYKRIREANIFKRFK